MTLAAREKSQAPTVRPPSLDLFLQTANAFHRTEALKAAIQLDLFTAIGDGADLEEVSHRSNISVRGIRIFCDYLVSIGFLKKEKAERYSPTLDSKTFLNRNSPFYVGDFAQVFFSPSVIEGFRNLASAVRTGTTVLEQGGLVAAEHPEWVTFARATTPVVRNVAESLASMLGADTEAGWKVLDIAAGSGLYGISVAKRYPNSRIVAVDWENVLSVARENALSEGVASRCSFLAGDAFHVDFGDGYDVALIPNFLHHFDLSSNENFLSRIHKALKPGGRAVIVETVRNEDRISPPDPVEFGLMMLATTKAGNAYTFSELETILIHAGFSNVEMHPLAPPLFSVFFALKMFQNRKDILEFEQ